MLIKTYKLSGPRKKLKSCQPWWSILGCPTRWFPPTWHWNIQKIEDVFNLMMMFQLLKVSFESVGDAPFFPSKTNHFQPQKMGSLRLTVISSTHLAVKFSRMSLNQDVSSLNDPISSIPQPSHIAFRHQLVYYQLNKNQVSLFFPSSLDRVLPHPCNANLILRKLSITSWENYQHLYTKYTIKVVQIHVFPIWP